MTILHLAACSYGGDDESVVQDVLRVPYVTWPLTQYQKEHVQGLNDFGLRLLKSIYSDETSINKGGNVFFSPLSVSYAMGMLSCGASGGSRNEITRELGFRNGDAQDMDDLFASLISGLTVIDDGSRFLFANALFHDESLSIKKEYSQRISQYYCATCKALDFGSTTSVDYINNWCSDKTLRQIPRIIDSLTPSIPLCLLSVVSFEGEWRWPFSSNQTSDRTFFHEDRSTENISMMHQVLRLDYVDLHGFRAVSIPFNDDCYSMMLLLPHTGMSMEEALNHLSAARIYDICDAQSPTMLDIVMPRFTQNATTDLIPHLRSIGITSVFGSDSAQLTGVSEQDMSVNLVLHKSHIQVDEAGTKASGVTVVTGDSGDAPSSQTSQIVSFHANHPFIYLIIEKKTFNITFTGVFTGL